LTIRYNRLPARALQIVLRFDKMATGSLTFHDLGRCGFVAGRLL
jgi:hypothetical protein